MTRRAVFLVESPFNRRDRERFGFDLLARRGLAAEAWDLTPVLKPEVAAKVRVNEPEASRVFASESEACAALSALTKDDFVFSIVGYGLSSLSVYRALSRGGAGYALLQWAALPAAVGPKPKLTPKKLLNALLMRTNPQWAGVRPPAFVVASGEGALRRRPPVTAATEVVWGHGLDYDLFLSLGEPKGRGAGAVFLDEDVPFHPDYVHLGVAPYSTASVYYPVMKKVFDHVEKALGQPVTIAAHPRSRYEERPEAFGKRPIVRGRTAELIRDAALVIAHGSTSINLAVLYRKPVLLVTTDDLAKSPEGPLIDAFGAALSQRVWNADRGTPQVSLDVDHAAFERYEARFVKKPGSPKKPLWDIVADRLAR